MVIVLTNDATAPTTSDFTPQTRFTVFAEDPSEIGKYA